MAGSAMGFERQVVAKSHSHKGSRRAKLCLEDSDPFMIVCLHVDRRD